MSITEYDAGSRLSHHIQPSGTTIARVRTTPTSEPDPILAHQLTAAAASVSARAPRPARTPAAGLQGHAEQDQRVQAVQQPGVGRLVAEDAERHLEHHEAQHDARPT